MNPVYLLCDTETGGFSPKFHPLLEYGWLYTDADFNPLEGDSICILPQEGKKIEEQAMAVNGYTPEIWEERGAVPLEEATVALRQKLALYPGLPIFAHDAPFDIRFCQYYLHHPEILGTKFNTDEEGKMTPAWECSKKMLRAYLNGRGIDTKGKGTLTLDAGCRHAGHVRRGSHGALEDCYAMAALLKFLKSQGVQRQAA